MLQRSGLIALLLITAFLAGCAGDDEGAGGTTTTTTTGPGGTAAGTTTTTTTTSPPGTGMPRMPPPRWDNVTVTDLLSCTLVAALVALGIPAEPGSQATSVDLFPEDAHATYTIDLISDAGEPAGQTFPLASLCVGIEGPPEENAFSFSYGETGTIPQNATALHIGGDFVFQGQVSVLIAHPEA